MSIRPLILSIERGWRTLVSRRVYFVAGALVPILFTFFFIDLMGEGLPLKAPSAILDLDNSTLSRQVTRNLASSEAIDLTASPTSFNDALTLVRKGDIFGFFMIPENFQKDAIGGSSPTITYYSNMTYFVPGTLTFKGFKTAAVTTTGGVALTKLTSAGLPDDMVSGMLQPVDIDIKAPGNPWLNYSIYLCNSFIPCLLALMVFLVTVYTICDEIKHGTSPQWLADAGGSITVAVVGKLLPQSVLFTLTGVAIQAIFYGFNHFPLNCHAFHMVFAMMLLVIACQGFALAICCILPNLRLALSICSLVGILSFSVTGFSFPVQSMYPAIGVFSYLIPIRYYFEIYADQALNGIPLYYSRFYYIALCLFPLVGLLGLGRLKKHCLKPVYVP